MADGRLDQRVKAAVDEAARLVRERAEAAVDDNNRVLATALKEA